MKRLQRIAQVGRRKRRGINVPICRKKYGYDSIATFNSLLYLLW